MTSVVGAFPTEIQMPVEVIGCDLSGQQFFETTETLTISRNEVSILLTRKLTADTEVVLRNPETNEEATACIVGQLPSDGDGHVYELVFLDPAVNLWHIKFPSTVSSRIVQLACSRCHGVGEQSLSELEVELLETAHELRLPCRKCNSLTKWRDSASVPPSKSPAGRAKQNPVPVSLAPPKEDRRKNKRSAMKMTASIRYSGMESVVTCDDISKGGFRFTCRKQYPAGTRVEVAVPYAPSTTNIFSLAVIKYCIPTTDGQFRHGVARLKNSSSDPWDS